MFGKRRSKAGATGLAGTEEETDEHVGHVGNMAETICTFVQRRKEYVPVTN